jgi:hypothetical protein
MSHHEAPQGWPTTGEQTDGSIVYPAPPNTGAEAGQMPELFPHGIRVESKDSIPFSRLTSEETADYCEDIRENINNQLDILLGKDLSMHFTVRDILSGLIKIKNSQVDNG